ncbi:unnamed protein product [Bursaphelenchus xylophilus]|uniref:(pine wood nematode) hypothetical protein n=1 Tax=Bursaphelenchus xylophilus TaxID=6326 RepID=A0A1I7SCD1_BURXY|nr:unnamed protein product [Bursaphelenchus xylophilus]CAG9094322.1 unnamed protein product [Bursaphelenchus xylophilus]
MFEIVDRELECVYYTSNILPYFELLPNFSYKTRPEKMGFVHSDEYYRCCCMRHVHKGCFVIGVIGFVLAVITAICTFMDGLILLGIGAAIHAFCYFLLLVGNRLRIHKLFLPILVVGIIAIIVYAVFAVLQIISLLQLSEESAPVEDEHYYNNRLSLLIMNLVFTVLSLLFSTYAFYVIYRDYWYLRDEPKKVGAHKVVTEVSVVQRTPDNRMVNREFIVVDKQSTSTASTHSS